MKKLFALILTLILCLSAAALAAPSVDRAGEPIALPETVARIVSMAPSTTRVLTDLGLGEFSLHYLRDKQKREVDFLVARDGIPWFLAEVKASDASLSKSLAHFQSLTCAPYAFQVILDRPFVPVDLFAAPSSPPLVVPALTFLSQLL